MREGGDSFGGRSLAVVPTRTVALFSGLVKVDADGNANVSLDIPDFNGELRLMAVAFTDKKLGHADRPLTVRDPVVADLVLPRFLAPGDHIQAGLNLDNVEGKPGNYSITVKTSGPLRRRRQRPVHARSQGGPARACARRVAGKWRRHRQHIADVERARPQALSRMAHRSAQPATRHGERKRCAGLPAGQSYTANKSLVANVIASTANVALTVSAAAPGYSNVPGQLRWLDKYPLRLHRTDNERCHAAALFQRRGETCRLPTDQALHDRIQNAIDRVLDMQNYGGDFGMWGPGSSTDPWVSAYRTRFRGRRRNPKAMWCPTKRCGAAPTGCARRRHRIRSATMHAPMLSMCWRIGPTESE